MSTSQYIGLGCLAFVLGAFAYYRITRAFGLGDKSSGCVGCLFLLLLPAAIPYAIYEYYDLPRKEAHRKEEAAAKHRVVAERENMIKTYAESLLNTKPALGPKGYTLDVIGKYPTATEIISALGEPDDRGKVDSKEEYLEYEVADESAKAGNQTNRVVATFFYDEKGKLREVMIRKRGRTYFHNQMSQPTLESLDAWICESHTSFSEKSKECGLIESH